MRRTDGQYVDAVRRGHHSIQAKRGWVGLPVVSNGDSECRAFNVRDLVEDGGEWIGLEIFVDGRVGAVAEHGKLMCPAADVRFHLIRNPVGLIVGVYMAGGRKDPVVVDMRRRGVERSADLHVTEQGSACDESPVLDAFVVVRLISEVRLRHERSK